MPSPTHRRPAQHLVLACICSLVVGGADAYVLSGTASFAQHTVPVLASAADGGGLVAFAKPAEAQPGFLFTNAEPDNTAWQLAPAGPPDNTAPQQMTMAEPGSLALAALGLAACLLLDRLERRRRRY